MNSRYSIIIPNYNHGLYLNKRIETVSNQSSSDFDCLILDDESSDSSISIISELIQNDLRFDTYYNFINSGSTFSQWNKGVALAKNNLIWIAESDDYADNKFVEKVSEPLIQDDTIALSFCQSSCIDKQGNSIGIWNNYISDTTRKIFSNDFIMDGKEFIDRFLIHENVIPNASAVIFRKDIYDEIGGADPSLKTNGDWLVWLKILCKGKVAFIAQPLNYFRIHDDSVIGKLKTNSSNLDYQEHYDRTLRIKFKKYLHSNKISLNQLSNYNNELYISYDDGNEGIFLLQKNNNWHGIRKILSASFNPSFKSGYLKKLFRFQ